MDETPHAPVAKTGTKLESSMLIESTPVLRILVIASWFGLLTGLAEAIFLVGWRQWYRQGMIKLSPHVLWMAPVAELLIFILIGAVLTLVAWRFPRVLSIRAASFILALLSMLALFLLLPQLHIYAKWILAAGLAFQISRIIAKHLVGFYRLVRISLILIVGIVLLLGIGTFVMESRIERDAISKLPSPPVDAPNVLLITLDMVRAKSLSLYGYERRTTPQLQQLASEGAIFDQAIAPSSWTLPSHASILTGRFPHELSASWTKPLDKTHATLAEVLGQRGYESAGFVGNLIFCPTEKGIARGMVHYEDYPVSVGQMIISASLGRAISNLGFIRKSVGYYDTLNRKSAEDINEDVLNWLAIRDSQRPFFMFVNYFDVHEPLLPKMPFDKKFGPTKTSGNFEYETDVIGFTGQTEWSETEIAHFTNTYDSSIAELDHQLGVLFRRLSEKGMLDNTLVIITADHGESIGEKSIFGHGNSLNIETLRVPLLIRFPSKVPKGMRN